MASGDTILYLTKRAVVVSGRFFFFSVIKNLKRRKIFQKTLYFVDRRPTKGIEALEYK